MALRKTKIKIFCTRQQKTKHVVESLERQSREWQATNPTACIMNARLTFVGHNEPVGGVLTVLYMGSE